MQPGSAAPEIPAAEEVRIWLYAVVCTTRQAIAIWTPRRTPIQFTGLTNIATSRVKGVSDGARTRDHRDHNPAWVVSLRAFCLLPGAFRVAELR